MISHCFEIPYLHRTIMRAHLVEIASEGLPANSESDGWRRIFMNDRQLHFELRRNSMSLVSTILRTTAHVAVERCS